MSASATWWQHAWWAFTRSGPYSPEYRAGYRAGYQDAERGVATQLPPTPEHRKKDWQS